ncbi:MAG TPA: hypothetical protein VFK10_07795, partial [Burkholderiaceae bacterium]|nr:hypothetical protein [Burkholderiaceae bacterium]
MPAHGNRSRSWTLGGLFAALAWACVPAPAQSPQATEAASAPARAEPDNSSLDAPLFYQLLIGEIELSAGHPGSAYEVVLDAAKRTRDEQLFRRACDIALQARAGEQALDATRAWRVAAPDSIDARKYQLQILVALNRIEEAGEPFKSWLALVAPEQRSAMIAATPRLLQRVTDRKQAAALLEQWLAPFRDAPATRSAVRVAQGRMWLAASEPDKALQLAQQAAADEADEAAPVMLAIELMPVKPEAEAIVTRYLAQPQVDTAVRLSYVTTLTRSQRYGEAAQQLDRLTQVEPNLAAPWLTLGALRLDMKQPREAEAALKRYVELVQKQPSAPADAADSDASDNTTETSDDRRLTQAW